MNKGKFTVLLLLLLFDLILIVSISIFSDNPKEYFKEFNLFTWISFIKLLIISYLSWNIYTERKPPGGSFSFNNDHSIWFIVACGFIFLAFDELLSIHENVDKAIHKVLDMPETGLTDRIDDAIILIYATLGIAVLYSYKNELIKFAKSIPYLAVGFLFLFLRISIDFITNRDDVIPKIISDEILVSKLAIVLPVIEGGSKLLAETFFIFVFYSCFMQVKSSKAGTQEQSFRITGK